MHWSPNVRKLTGGASQVDGKRGHVYLVVQEITRPERLVEFDSVLRLGTERHPDEGLRLGTVRRHPRGVRTIPTKRDRPQPFPGHLSNRRIGARSGTHTS